MRLAKVIALTPFGSSSARLRFDDGADGVVAFAPLVREGGVFATLDAARLMVVRSGRAVTWTDPDGEEADMDADTPCRMIADARAAA